MKGLTGKQRSVLCYLARYSQQRGFMPSIRELQEEFNFSSLRGATVHLDALEAKGVIERYSTPRSINILDDSHLPPDLRKNHHPHWGNVRCQIKVIKELAKRSDALSYAVQSLEKELGEWIGEEAE